MLADPPRIGGRGRIRTETGAIALLYFKTDPLFLLDLVYFFLLFGPRRRQRPLVSPIISI